MGVGTCSFMCALRCWSIRSLCSCCTFCSRCLVFLLLLSLLLSLLSLLLLSWLLSWLLYMRVCERNANFNVQHRLAPVFVQQKHTPYSPLLLSTLAACFARLLEFVHLSAQLTSKLLLASHFHICSFHLLVEFVDAVALVAQRTLQLRDLDMQTCSYNINTSLRAHIHNANMQFT